MAERNKDLFEKSTELEDGRIQVSFSNGDAILSKERYLAYKEKIKKANEFYKQRAEQEKANPVLNKRLLQILYPIYNQEFEEIAKCVDCEIKEFNEISITKEAYNKANLIAKRMYNLKGNNEIYLHLLNSIEKKKKGDFTQRDVFIPHEQTVTPVTCALKSPQGKIADSQEIREAGNYVSGWAHSHSKMQTFHSGTDNNNLLTEVMNGTTLPIALDPFRGQNLTSYSFRFFPSMVFNALGDKPSCAIAVDHPYFELGKGLTMKTHINYSPRLNILEEKNSINLDTKEIDSQIEERIISSKGYFKKNLEEKSKKEKRKNNSPEYWRVFKRLSFLEENYSLLLNQFKRLHVENKLLRDKVRTLEDLLIGDDDEFETGTPTKY